MSPRLALLLLPLVACTGGEEEPQETWKLVWSDEFQGEEGAPPNPDNWTFDVGGDGWGNNQLEHNTDRSINSSLDGNGFLRIVAREEAFEGNAYTSARLKSEGLQAFRYGKIEARIKVPKGSGMWPAFWMLGADFQEVGWPACGEIDIMELRGGQPNIALGTVHGPGYNGGGGITDSVVFEQDLSDDFHVYGVEWDEDHIQWYVDDTYYHRIHPGDLPPGSPWVFDHEFFLLLNLAVGGVFVQPLDDTTEFPNALGVDWVRVYERRVPLREPTAEEILAEIEGEDEDETSETVGSSE